MRRRNLSRSIGVLFLLILIIWTRKWFYGMEQPVISRFQFKIGTSWDSQPLDHQPVELSLYGTEHGMVVEVDAPFFNDPPAPDGKPGHPLQGLWDYEVVETFFLNDQNNYLEVEYCPHGQHLVLLLRDYRKPFKDMLNITYSSVIDGNSWTGKAIIPWEYVPQNISRFNAYAIHGSGKDRTYEALFPVPLGQFSEPDFHRLDFFQRVDFDVIIPASVRNRSPSDFWKL